jgi:hypothetical protein
VWVGGRFGDNTENQNASEEQKLNQEKQSQQARTVPARCPCEQPNGGDRKDKNWDRQNLRRVDAPAADHPRAYDHNVAGYVSGEYIAKSHEASQVHHARDDAEQG